MKAEFLSYFSFKYMKIIQLYCLLIHYFTSLPYANLNYDVRNPIGFKLFQPMYSFLEHLKRLMTQSFAPKR